MWPKSCAKCNTQACVSCSLWIFMEGKEQEESEHDYKQRWTKQQDKFNWFHINICADQCSSQTPFLHREQHAITIEIAFRKAHSCCAPSSLFSTTVTADRPHIIGVPMLLLPLCWITTQSNGLHFHFDVLMVNWLSVRKLTVSGRFKEASEPDHFKSYFRCF